MLSQCQNIYCVYTIHVRVNARLLSPAEMTYIVSGGALNSTHSLTHCHAVQVVTAGRVAMLVAEGMHRNFLTSHRQARQPIDADWKVSIEIQANAGTATTEEGWARPLIARELQAHIQSVNRLEDP